MSGATRPGCADLAEASGLHVVMGCGWYRTAYYPPEALIDRRSVDDLADELVAEIEGGVGETGVRPGHHRRDRHRQAVGLAGRGARPSGGRARAARRTGLAITTHAVLSDVGLAQLRIFEEEGADPARVVIGHADSYQVLDHYLAILERGANLEFDFIGMPWERERIGEARTIELVCELLGRGHADRLFLSQDVCNDSQLTAFGGNGYTYLTESFLPRLRAAGVSRRGDRDDDGGEPAPAPDDRLGPGRRAQPSSVASTLSATLPFRAWLIGQPSFAPSAAATKSAALDARDATADGQRARHDAPARVELVEGDLGGDVEPLRRRARPPSAPRSAIEKHAAWAAATSSSGLVRPFDASVRAAQRHGQGRERPGRDRGDGAGTGGEGARPGGFGAADGGHRGLLNAARDGWTHRPTGAARMSRAVRSGRGRCGSVDGRSGARTNATGRP